MGRALGEMKISPPDFWNMATPEFIAAVEGHEVAAGLRSSKMYLSQDDVDELVELANSET